MRDGWQRTPLGDVTTQIVSPVTVKDQAEYVSLGLRMYAGGVFAREPKKGTEIKATRLFKVRPGQFIYNRLFASGGSFGLVRAEHAEGVVSNEFPVFDLDTSRLLPEYLYLHFQQRGVWGTVAEQCIGTTKTRLRWKEGRFNEYTVLLPPLVEQERIVGLIAALDNTIEQTKDQASSLGVVGQRLRDAVPTAETFQLGDLLHGIESGTSTKVVEAPGRRVNMLTLAGIRPAKFHAEAVKDVGAATLPDKAILREGDLLITRSNTPDRVGYVCIARGAPKDAYLPDLVWRLVPNEDLVSKEYLEQVLSSTQMREQISGSASGTSASMRKINKSGFSRLMIPVPDKVAQDSYVVPLKRVATTLDALRESIQVLESLRSNLLMALLSGMHQIPDTYDALIGEAA